MFKTELLPQSETFIRAQVAALQHWDAVLVGHYPSLQGLRLDGLAVLYLQRHAPRTYLGRAARLLERLLGATSRSKLRTLAQQSADLVHVHFATELVLNQPLLNALGLPVLTSLHGSDITIERSWWESGHGGTFMRSYPRRLLRLSAQPNIHFVAVSEAIRERAIDYGIPANKITVRYVGVDTRVFAPGPVPLDRRRNRVLFVGRLVEKKGLEVLLHAVARAKHAITGLSLSVIGDGPLRRHYERLATELGVDVEFLGTQPQERVRSEFHQSRVFCLPSVRASNGDAEGLGLVLLEAQACGVPVIATSLGGMREALLDGVTGFTFPERDYEALGDRLVRVLADDELLLGMSDAARTWVTKKFDLARCTEHLEELYDSLAAKRSEVAAHRFPHRRS